MARQRAAVREDDPPRHVGDPVPKLGVDEVRKPSEEEIYVWNEFMRKRGWNDEASDTLKRRKKESGMAGRSEIETMFNYIDADEGRGWMSPPRPVDQV